MKDVLRIALLVINIVSCIAVLLFGAFGVLAEILNPPVFEKMLSKLKIPISFERFLFIGFICLAVLAITYFLRKKFFK